MVRNTHYLIASSGSAYRLVYFYSSYEFIIVSGLRISITENFSVVQGASHNFYHRHLSTHLACQVGFLYNRKMKLYRNLKGMSIGDCF